MWSERDKYTSKKGNEGMILNINFKIILDNKHVAYSFNQYFTTVPQQLLDKHGALTSKFKEYLANPNPDSFILHPITLEEVNNITTNLEKSKSCESYHIPPKLIARSN